MNRCHLVSGYKLVGIILKSHNPVNLATHKGFIDNRPLMLEYLEEFDDGFSISSGVWLDRDTEQIFKTQK